MAHCACVARSQESGAEQSANMNLGVSMLRILFLLGETTISSKDTYAVLPFHQSWYTKYGEVSPSVTACSSDVKALFSSSILIGLSTLFLVASAQIYANSPTTESDKFPKICLLTSRNDFSFCRQSG
ncbi:transmembrane protein 273 isoform X20 [Macaca nemestrina]|uniref:transmembrane protein 273 isoform X20 n=2 Tax=Macaca TaxID=9539 RepID=UPI0039B91B9A